MSRLGAAAVHLDATPASELGNLCFADLRLYPVVALISFIGYDYDLHICFAVLLHFGEPDSQVIEALLLEEVEAQYDALGSLVVRVSDCSIPFLSGCVPNLQLDFATAMVDGAEAKVDSDRRRVVLDEVIVGEPDEKAGLSDARVAEQDELEQVVVLLAPQSLCHVYY